MSTDPSHDLDLVIGTALSMGQDQLNQQGAVMPFAVVLENDAATARRAADGDDAPDDGQPPLRLVFVAPEEETEEVDAEDTIEDLYLALVEQAADIDAAAIVSDVTLLDSDAAGDALHVTAEHRSGDVVALLQPYTEAQGEYTWGELEPDGAEPRIFTN
ncbi:MAG: hypothetical protein ACTII7_06520 [Galactobacter sp.]